MTQLIERRWAEVDSDIAKHYMKYNNYHSQRDLRDQHVYELEEKMRSGLFRFGDVAFAKLNGNEILMNGQHFLQAVINTGTIVPAALEKYKCDDENELATLFRQFEILPRSISDMVKAKHHALSIKAWPLWISKLVVSAATLEYKGGDNWRTGKFKGFGVTTGIITAGRTNQAYLTKDKKVELLEQYLPEAQFLSGLLRSEEEILVRRKLRHIAKAPIAMMIFKTNRVNHKDARAFWNRVIWGENLKREMPSYVLRAWFTEASQRRKKNSGEIAATNHEYVYKSALAWNAFRKNTTTTIPYRIWAQIPKLV